MNRLNGKTAVITGGAAGIGRAEANCFIEEGALVCIFGRRQEVLDVAVADLDRLYAAVKAERGTLDIVFANAGTGTLAEDPNVKGDRRVVFLSSDDEGAAETVAVLAEQLGFASVHLGKLDGGGALVQARGNSWGPLIFRDLFKQGPQAMQGQHG